MIHQKGGGGNMILYRNIVIVLAFLLLAGCATKYQPMGFSGGYKDGHIKDNIYFVEVVTNSFTSQTVAAQYFHRRAKEVCLENGYKDYKIQGERDTSTILATGGYGGGVISASTSNKPGFSGYVECLECINTDFRGTI
jgi:hypothetical protein